MLEFIAMKRKRNKNLIFYSLVLIIRRCDEPAKNLQSFNIPMRVTVNTLFSLDNRAVRQLFCIRNNHEII
jgi:hypothetical protein